MFFSLIFLNNIFFSNIVVASYLYNQSAISLSGQIDLFKEYIGKLKGLVGDDRTNFILANSIFLVVVGSNDISNTYFLSHTRQLQYDVPAYTDLMLASASSFLTVCDVFLFYTSVTNLCDAQIYIQLFNFSLIKRKYITWVRGG